MEREKQNPPKVVNEEKATKLLIRSGGLVAGIGSLGIIEGLGLNYGEIGSLGLLVSGVGVSLILTGVRRRK